MCVTLIRSWNKEQQHLPTCLFWNPGTSTCLLWTPSHTTFWCFSFGFFDYGWLHFQPKVSLHTGGNRRPVFIDCVINYIRDHIAQWELDGTCRLILKGKLRRSQYCRLLQELTCLSLVSTCRLPKTPRCLRSSASSWNNGLFLCSQELKSVERRPGKAVLISVNSVLPSIKAELEFVVDVFTPFPVQFSLSYSIITL